ncbi:hypothetical protein [Alienimonas chondri]|uniref:Secreted protein n=1 Tax=Alienimonas chondri TaxID=2681879 RepID=A0ABX1VBL5_9PLAN|nr:hypothetical protein [Alienimonas chondri]NNJ24728.1 hypothetical protein [Alienimonas chondri]
MFRSLVTAATLLALTICPFRCAASGCSVSRDEANAEAVHCRCCPQADSDDSTRDAPTKDDESPSPSHGGCQCQGICSGAVLPDAVEVPTTLSLAVLLDAPAERLSSATTIDHVPAFAGDAGPRRSGGLRLCILLSTLLT